MTNKKLPKDSEVVTRGILKEELSKEFKTFKGELKKEFATKDDLKQAINNLDEKFATKDDLNDMADLVIGRLEKYMDQTKNEMMTHIDHISKGIDDMRTENTVGTHQIREIRIQVDDHDKRITTLETA